MTSMTQPMTGSGVDYSMTAFAIDPTEQPTINVIVRATRQLTAKISAFELSAEGPEPLPEFRPGAHISVDLLVNGLPARRSYSLVNKAGDGHYEIAVMRDDSGAGGSKQMHCLKSGDRLAITAPKNAFPLASGRQPSLLIAGGIGITPILAMARELAARGEQYEIHYVTRTPEDMAYREDVAGLANALLYFDGGDHHKGIPLDDLLASHDGRHVYVCGPAPLIKGVIDRCDLFGWPEETLHYELFAGVLAKDGDKAFTVEMRTSGIVVEVPATMSILDVAISNGIFAPFECRQGECGMCMTQVLEGAIDHRDHYLTGDERAAQQSMCICVSRAKGSHIILDM